MLELIVCIIIIFAKEVIFLVQLVGLFVSQAGLGENYYPNIGPNEWYNIVQQRTHYIAK